MNGGFVRRDVIPGGELVQIVRPDSGQPNVRIAIDAAPGMQVLCGGTEPSAQEIIQQIQTGRG